MKKKINYKFILIGCILLVFLGLFYFKFSLIVSPDGSTYYYYTKIFDGIMPFKMWNNMRGFSFPLLIFLFKHLFGDNSIGILIGFFLFELLLIFMGSIILNKFLKEYRLSKNNFIYWVLFILLIMFNPLIIGYSHTLVTEAVAPAIIMLALYLSYVWKEILWNNSKTKVIFHTLIFAITLIFMWFLKQPYMPIIFLLYFISSILSSISLKSWKVFFEKISCCFIALLFLGLSIFTWNKILIFNKVNINNSTSNSHYLANGIILGMNYHFNVEPASNVCDINFIKNSNLNEKDKASVIELSKKDKKWCKKIKIFNIVKGGNLIDTKLMVYKNGMLSVSDSMKFLISNFLEHPILILHGYYKNYMTTIDFYPYTVLPDMSYIAGNKFDSTVEHENLSLAYLTYSNVPLCWWQYFSIPKETLEKDEVKSMKNYEDWQEIDENMQNIIFNNIKPIYQMIFRISLLLLLPLSLFCFIKLIRDKQNIKYFLTTIIFASSFIHILFHAVMGSIIDRYAYVVMPISLLGYIILFTLKGKSENMKKSIIIEHKKNGKLIFVIPAYNEEKNIEKVINDIHKNMPKADIVVTNDYSKDNTREIVEKLNVPCLNVPFNLGYAMAVQTGIKYAYKNDYDYVILFDADGQHLASEAKKLVNKMKETNANIIIGSRFIEKTDYKHPFFRKIGTKMFQIIIKLFCHKKITDPTSGFQLLDKSVIERYAKIGKYPEFPDANLIIEMLLNGYEIEEVSVKMKLNDTGQSMHSGIIKPIKYMINVTYSIIFILIKGKSNREE